MGCCDETEVRRVIHKVHRGHGFGGHWMHGPHFGGPSVMVVCDCHGHGHGHGHDYSAEDELKDLEEIQRDLEQEVANIADRIKELRGQIAEEEEADETDE